MAENLNYFFSVWIKLFFLLTPFFVLTMFLAYTKDKEERERRGLAVKVGAAVALASLVLYFFGNWIFAVFGITIDSFRIGAGALLFLSAVALIRGEKPEARTEDGDIAVVPLAIPMTIGPATTGALLVMGAENHNAAQTMAGCSALVMAALCVGVMLFLSASIHRLVGSRGLTILSKLTGLILSALAAQMVFSGIKNFMR